MNNGDVIEFNRRGYTHYAIFIEAQPDAGNGVVENSVIHWWKDVGMLEPSVLITPFQGLADNVTHETVIIEDIGIDFNQVVPRAMAFKQRLDDLRMEGRNVSGLFDNSYHFVDWCRNRLGRIIITQEEILAVRDPRRFVHGSVTNTEPLPDTIQMLRNIRAGDIIRFFHLDYEHWALCLGNQEGVQRGIHWWDRDSVRLPNIEIQELSIIAGYCQVEIDQYSMDVDGGLAANRSIMFREFVARFANIIDWFRDPRQFAFFCCFGLGIQTEPEFDRFIGMADEAPVREVVEGLIQTSAPDVIRRNHNDAIRVTLTEGDLIKFSQGSQEYFGLYIVQGIPCVMWWMENGPPTIMVDNFVTLAAHMKVERKHPNEKYTETHNLVEMVNRANALRTKINTTDDNYIGLFANSKHFAVWIFDTYGPIGARITLEEIARVDVWQHIYKLTKTTKPQWKKTLIRRQNKLVLDALKAGDLVMFHRTIQKPIIGELIKYDHYAVYIANSDESGALSVIHWWNNPNNDFLHWRTKAFLRTDSFWTVAGYDAAGNGNNDELENRYIDGHTVVRKAITLKADYYKQEEKDREQYHVLYNNCEHFANECRYGDKTSRQVKELRDKINKILGVATPAINFLGRMRPGASS